ncbi:ABC transporter substrate-binding protein [Paenibacillus sp. JX-17]|uniref:ABC transporter substrate-binding protein n=1 Tax=Paenibacillus lacisoli TaxID=3064525 RepID=A0ABT9CJ81_9BACL|nr:ABC transporter substrate-binding protein [Paenibacillus sp. JX-17]MDO7907992.1 ABC transporter substrate-binding protein [Paenibacillus sp. JX-17]
MSIFHSKTNKKRKNYWKAAFIVSSLLAVMLVQGCSSSKGANEAASADSEKPTVFNYGYIGINKLNVPSSGAEGWGFYKGIIQEELKKHGITQVNLTAFPNGPDQTESLVSGRLDAGSLGDTPAIIAYASGAKTRLIAQPATNSIGYLIAKKGGAASVKDLQGKTIAIQKGSFMHRYVVGLLKKEGVSDYKLVHMLIPDASAALARGDVDAMTNNGVQALKQINEGYPLLDDATKHPDLIGTGATVASEAFLAKFPDFPKVWNEARLKALDDLKQHEDEYYQFAADAQGTTPDVIKKISPISQIKDTPFTDEGLKLIEGTKNFLVEEKLAKKDFNINDWVLK